MENFVQNKYAPNNWMAATPAIDTLSLCELSLPGTHNAGCDWKASYALIPGAHWLACQHDSFYSQLSNGSRALDVRLIYDADAPGLGKFRFHHNRYLSSRTLGHLQTDLSRFLDENPDEFVILDFHELTNGGKPFDYKYFNDMMVRFLGDRIIPAKNIYLSVGQLKKISRRQRIVVATPWDRALDINLFCRLIEGKWSGIDTANSREVEKFITGVMKNPPGRWEPWSLSATSYSVLGGPVDIHDDLNKWFDPTKSDWAAKSNIISIDFMEETQIVSYCRTANLKKAARRASGLPLY
ncbi:phospholipase [Pseudomonas sp. NPDC086278]|uniref:phospholipase n=1 Tax=Pseudomonas sp. NPDC086278 TaxID=3390646 RepID=UPI003CFDED0C